MSTKEKAVKPQLKIQVKVKPRSASFADPLKYKVIGDEQKLLTKELAFKFLELETFAGERPVRERHVQFLYDEWVGSRFLWQNVILASAAVGGKTYRINGQHTCWMRVSIPERDEPVKNALVRVVEYKVEDENALRNLYTVFDRAAPRTAGHIGQVMLMGKGAAAGIPSSYTTKMLAGFRIFFAPDWRDARANIPEMVGLIDKSYSTLFNIVGNFFTMHYSDSIIVRRAAVIAAMMSTFDKSVEKSDEFWTAVFTGLNLDNKTDPRWQLRRFMETHSHTIRRGQETINQEALYCTCLTMWNHWRAGTTVSKVNPTWDRPKVRA